MFGRKPKLLLNLETTSDVKVSGTFKDNYNLFKKRFQYLHKLLQDFKSKMINKDRSFFQHGSGDLVYIISTLNSQFHTASIKVMIKYLGPIVIYKTIGPHNYSLMILNGKILRGLFEHERLKPANIRTSQGNVHSLMQLKQVINIGMKV